MKLAPSNNNPNQAHHRDSIAVIPLIPKPTDEKNKKERKVNEYKLWSDPTDQENSTEYKVKAEVFESDGENCIEDYCRFRDTLSDICKGQMIDKNPSALHQLILQLLKGEAFDTYKTATDLAIDDAKKNKVTLEIVNEGLIKLSHLVFPMERKQGTGDTFDATSQSLGR